jgi:anti-sigma B factor antagonist
MIVKSRQESDGTVVLTVVVASMDRSNATEFREVAAQAIEASMGPVVVDCTRLEFLDSSGLGALLHAQKLLPEERRPICLRGVGSKVLTLLELMQVHRIFALEPRV